MNRRYFLKALSMGSLLLAAQSWPKLSFGQSLGNVLVIGAGISGLTAARQLVASGFTVTILEARSRLGGRIFTDSTLGVPVDLGAAWIEGMDGNPMTTLAETYSAGTTIDNGDIFLFDKAGRQTPSRTLRQGRRIYGSIFDRALEIAEERDTDISLGKLLSLELQKLRSRTSKGALHAARFFIEQDTSLELAANAKYISAWYADDDEAFPGEDAFLSLGYHEIAQGLASGLDIRLGTQVQQIIYSDSGVSIATSAGDFQADRVLVTLPLGVLKNGTVEFSPALPEEKLAAISRLDMGVMNKVALRYDAPFWNELGASVGSFCQFNSKRAASGLVETVEFVNLEPVVGTPVLVAYMGGDFAKHSEGLSDLDLSALCQARLQGIFGASIPSPSAMVRTRWNSDPFTYGSYSFIPVHAFGEDRGTLAEPIGNRVFFAGEATNAVYPATVHGAYFSGLREAERIVESVA